MSAAMCVGALKRAAVPKPSAVPAALDPAKVNTCAPVALRMLLPLAITTKPLRLLGHVVTPRGALSVEEVHQESMLPAAPVLPTYVCKPQAQGCCALRPLAGQAENGVQATADAAPPAQVWPRGQITGFAVPPVQV